MAGEGWTEKKGGIYGLAIFPWTCADFVVKFESSPNNIRQMLPVQLNGSGSLESESEYGE